MRLYLIDGSSQMYRAYHAPVRTAEGGFLRNAQGRPTNAVYIFVTMLRKLLNEHKPEYIAASFDLPGRTFRDDLVSDYKANRAPMPDELAEQIPMVHAACEALGVGVFPWSPLGGGVLTGKYRGGMPSDSRAAIGHRSNLIDVDDPSAAGIVEAVATAAEGLATSPVAVALAWLRDRPGVSAPILGARTLGQLTGALASEALEIPREIASALDDVSAPAVGYPEDVS